MCAIIGLTLRWFSNCFSLSVLFSVLVLDFSFNFIFSFSFNFSFSFSFSFSFVLIRNCIIMVCLIERGI